MNNEYLKLVEQTLEINQTQQRLICHQLKNNDSDLELLNEGWLSSITHGTLDIVGLIPGIGEPFDIANGLIYVAEGDMINAGLSFTAAVPIVGDMIKVAGRSTQVGIKMFKMAKEGEKGIELIKITKKLEKANDSIKLGKKLSNKSIIKKEIIKSLKKGIKTSGKATSKIAKKGTAIRGVYDIAKGGIEKTWKDISTVGLKTLLVGGTVVLVATLLWYIKPILKFIYKGFETMINYAKYISSDLVKTLKETYAKFEDWFNSNKKYAVDPKEILALKV